LTTINVLEELLAHERYRGLCEIDRRPAPRRGIPPRTKAIPTQGYRTLASPRAIRSSAEEGPPLEDDEDGESL